ncbi:ABC transporter substrate-binding protein [Pseudonocardia cypriaca]|uniref:Carbohydrate ABC transporter substrate-binding protein (CUT1 family) n=1 Tax=Pseudonocardia cypriaca TaxID=882449 RepID=A0A543GA44_9PSEU|nr:extracellular solute-binding protein [Pseudonocardia cypriaca]TQM42967.1 carbohydrate ABC transporter substrate-binding protein (CUT1 family) [Pseudonocardia cypriaca]
MRSTTIASLAAVAALTLAACGGGGSSGSSGAGGPISGEITVLTHRTDIVDTVFADYERRFKEIHPDVEVEFEAITDYDGEVRIRLNAQEYGDVLMLPDAVTKDQLPQFFEPLGTLEEMSRKYRFATEKAYEGQVYGIAITGNANGFVYNRRIWQQAGVTEAPKTPDEFIAALQAIADRTDAVPLYTNYADGWPLGAQWAGHRGGISNNPDAVNEMATTDAPWTPGSELYVIDSLLFDAVQRGLTEPDPTTTEWELSKQLLGTGQIATMNLGSWSIVQMREAAPNPDDIGYLPFPVQVDGKFHSVIAGDFKQGINVHSDNKAAARAWVDWFADQSNYATDQGGISPLLNGPEPTTLKDFADLGVEYFELTPEPPGKEGLVDRIDDESEIGVTEHLYRQRLVDAARGARPETKEQIFAELNQRWAAARAETD